MNNILPCPFCGSKRITVDVVFPNEPDRGYGVTCHTNGCIGNIYQPNVYYSTPKSVIKAWNKRSA